MYFSKADKREVEKRYIRLDKHIQRLVFSGFLDKKRAEFKIPKRGFKRIEDYKQWLDRLERRKKFNDWDKCVREGLSLANLPESYFDNIAQVIALDFLGVYDLNQPGVPHHRSDKDYFRSKRITELSLKINPVTHKKIKAKYVARKYRVADNVFDNLPQKEADRLIDKFEVGGPEVRKIASRFKKQILK